MAFVGEIKNRDIGNFKLLFLFVFALCKLIIEDYLITVLVMFKKRHVYAVLLK